MKVFLPLTGLFLILIFLSYIESPYSFINKDHVRMTSIPNEVILAEAEAAKNPSISQEEEANAEATEEVDESDEVAALNFSLELVLEDKSEMDGYVVETYQEYEFYKDDHGNVVKKVPTSNYNYLRYKK